MGHLSRQPVRPDRRHDRRSAGAGDDRGRRPAAAGRPREVDGKGSFVGPPRNRFKLEVGFKESPLADHVEYHDRSANKRLRSQTITSATCTGDHAVIEGTGTIRKDAVRFRIEVTDGGKKGGGDTFSISWPGYAAGGPLDRGDIDVSCDLARREGP